MLVSIIISVYNEEEGLNSFWKSLQSTLSKQNDINFELLWVNDGSKDNSQKIIDEIISGAIDAGYIHHKRIEFSRNFGHEAAMIAGIDEATGEALICLDSDNQHPTELISKMLDSYKSGYEIVLMKYEKRDDVKWKLWASSLFYKFSNMLAEEQYINGATDFFLITNEVAGILRKNFRNKTRFIRSYIQVIGFNKLVLEFDAGKREYGQSKYSFAQLFRLAVNSVFFTSNSLFKIAAYLSFFFILIGLVLSVYTLKNFLLSHPPSGYTTIILFLSISFSLIFMVLFIVCLYLSKLVVETRNEPLYIIRGKKK